MWKGPPMNKAMAPNRLADLLKFFNVLVDLHDDLLALIREKVDAMKHSDIQRMQALTEREHALAKRIHEREGYRRQLMDAIGEQLNLPPRAARALSVSQLAGRIPEPQRSALLEAARRLRARVTRTAAANRAAGTIARQITSHLRWVFASVKPREDGPVGYSGDGVSVGCGGTKILDAVG